MEKEKKIVNGPSLKNCSENTISKEEMKNIDDMRIYGFEDSMSVARTLMGNIHEVLLKGELVFAYRSTSPSNKTSLCQVVVVNDLEADEYGKIHRTGLFSISTITSGYTSLLPHMPVNYLDEVVKDLEDGKADKKVIENFKVIVEDLKKKC